MGFEAVGFGNGQIALIDVLLKNLPFRFVAAITDSCDIYLKLPRQW